MSQERLPPPAPTCLVRRYGSSQKGGTLIVEDVLDLHAHEQRICSPDGYRPQQCPGCQFVGLHVHDYRERCLRGQPGKPTTRVVRHWCPGCGAVWLVLPLLLARWLWRTWQVVEAQTLGPAPPSDAPRVPERTVRRWAARLAASARHVAQVLATTADALLECVAGVVGLDATRQQLVDAYAAAAHIPPGQRLATLAALLQRLAPGVRLM